MNQFNGSVLYNIIFVADVCNPVEGMVVPANVININKMGILAYGGYEEPYPLNILLAKQHHIDNEYFDSVKENDNIFVKVIGIRKEYGDSQISIIGKLMDKDEVDVAKEEKKKWNKKLLISIINLKIINGYQHIIKEIILTIKVVIMRPIEHAFNSQKNMDSDYQDLFTVGTETYLGEDPAVAKKTGKNTNLKKMKKKLIENWDTEQIGIMKDIIRIFLESNIEVKEKLVNTGDAQLINSGPGVDSFWGLNKGEGENHHGKILMELRKEIEINNSL